jgi:polyisoprenyl-phosphate glycosyltransferase
MLEDVKSLNQPSVNPVASSNLKFSVVIPVFNEESNLPLLYTRLSAVMKSLDDSYEIIFVDDGSRDASFKIIKDLHEKDNHVKVIRFTRNFGQHPAIMAGFQVVQGGIIITIDSDLQNPPEEIPRMVQKLNEGYEIVFGVFMHRKSSSFKKVSSEFTKKVLSKIVPVETTNLSAFRVMKYYVIDQLKLLNEKSKFLDGLICWMGFRIGTLDVEHSKRYAGKTKYNFFKMLNLWFDMIVSLTDVPLKIATYGGIGFSIASFLLTFFYILRYFLVGYGIPGFATTVIFITFFAGVQLFCLGMLGEYIGRMSKEVKNKPEYIIRDILSGTGKK